MGRRVVYAASLIPAAYLAGCLAAALLGRATGRRCGLPVPTWRDTAALVADSWRIDLTHLTNP